MKRFLIIMVLVVPCLLVSPGCQRHPANYGDLFVTPFRGTPGHPPAALDGGAFSQSDDKDTSGGIFLAEISAENWMDEAIEDRFRVYCEIYDIEDDGYYGYGVYNPGSIFDETGPGGQTYGEWGFYGEDADNEGPVRSGWTDEETGELLWYAVLGSRSLIASQGGQQPFDEWDWKPRDADVVDDFVTFKFWLERHDQHGGDIVEYFHCIWFQGQYMGFFDTSPSIFQTSFSGTGRIESPYTSMSSGDGALSLSFIPLDERIMPPPYMDMVALSEANPSVFVEREPIQFTSPKTPGEGIPRIKAVPEQDVMIEQQLLMESAFADVNATIEWESWGKLYEDSNGVIWWYEVNDITTLPVTEPNDFLKPLPYAHAGALRLEEPVCIEVGSSMPVTASMKIVNINNHDDINDMFPLTYTVVDVSPDRRTLTGVSSRVRFIDNPDFRGWYEDRLVVPVPLNYGPLIEPYDANNFPDFDLDGKIGMLDLNVMAERWLSHEPYDGFDANRDCYLDVSDFGSFSDCWLDDCSCFDDNNDKIVNFVDFAAFAAKWKNFVTVQSNYDPALDANKDGTIDFRDFAAFAEKWSQ